MDEIHKTGRDRFDLIPGLILKGLKRQAQSLKVHRTPESELESGVLAGRDILDLGIRMRPGGLGQQFLKRVYSLERDLFVAARHEGDNRQRQGSDGKAELFHIQ